MWRETHSGTTERSLTINVYQKWLLGQQTVCRSGPPLVLAPKITPVTFYYPSTGNFLLRISSFSSRHLFRVLSVFIKSYWALYVDLAYGVTIFYGWKLISGKGWRPFRLMALIFIAKITCKLWQFSNDKHLSHFQNFRTGTRVPKKTPNWVLDSKMSRQRQP